MADRRATSRTTRSSGCRSLELIEHGKRLFAANWTDQEGGGRPLMKGTGKELTDPSQPLVGSRAFNRISAPDANSCAGCHNAPFGIAGGGGDFVTNVFVLAQRFDFVTFDRDDTMPTRRGVDEGEQADPPRHASATRARRRACSAPAISRCWRARSPTDLHAIRDSMKLGESRELVSKGISFGTLTRRADGMWDTSKVEGLPRLSILAPMPIDRPSLVIRPWHQAANVVSLREFIEHAFNHHHGIQTTERFGRNTDLDGDGFVNEMTRADVTAVVGVPGDAGGRRAGSFRATARSRKRCSHGERAFARIGCARCHVPELPLTRPGGCSPSRIPTTRRPTCGPAMRRRCASI